MKKLILFILPVLLFSCGDEGKKETEETVKLISEKDRLSYVLGAMNAKTIVGTPDPNIQRLDMEIIAKGFAANLNNNNPVDCEATLMKLFGPNFQDFDSTYAKEGAECLGRLTGYAFYQDMVKMGGLSSVDMKMAKIGFRHGLLKKDDLISDSEKQTIIQNFIKDLTIRSGDKMMADAKLIKGAEVFENGIVLEKISDGKGASPSGKDDVKVEYILISALGDTMQSSYAMKKATGNLEPVSLRLNGGVIPGWTFAIPKMKKGGKYKLYVPWKLAYGERGMFNEQAGRYDIQPFESLCFIIELVDFAKEGTFVKPEPQIAMPTQ
jgi:FKBP-type peptidyl-prolyl cis-trans isomerase FklB